MRVSLIATYTTLYRNSFYGRNKEKRPGAWSNRPWIIFVHENIKNLWHPDRLSMNFRSQKCELYQIQTHLPMLALKVNWVGQIGANLVSFP